MLHNEGTLSLNIVSAQDMPDVEKFGKQDPYVQFTLNLNDKNSFQKTFVQEDAGKSATWNQSFELKLVGEPELFVEVMDKEKGVDEIIGFCAIPINQVAQAPGGTMNGRFNLFLVNGENAGSIDIGMTVQGFNSPPGNQNSQQKVQGRSYISEEHLKRLKSMKHKAFAGDVGTAVLGGALAVGAGFLGNKLYKDHEKKEQEKQEEEEQREKFAQDQKKLEEDRARFDQERAEAEKRRQQQEQQQKQHQHEGRSEHHGGGGHDHHHHDHHHSGSDHGAREWDPVGTYAAGDRVEYHGRTYMCLQGHTSNPTWQPGSAHSLWQTA
ncbi:C2 domain-containing protein [Fennellomyces sp. T-0311]|nr:C2 domain-containing protein [Fennellomyces sp. T-0311]